VSEREMDKPLKEKWVCLKTGNPAPLLDAYRRTSSKRIGAPAQKKIEESIILRLKARRPMEGSRKRNEIGPGSTEECEEEKKNSDSTKKKHKSPQPKKRLKTQQSKTPKKDDRGGHPPFEKEINVQPETWRHRGLCLVVGKAEWGLRGSMPGASVTIGGAAGQKTRRSQEGGGLMCQKSHTCLNEGKEASHAVLGEVFVRAECFQKGENAKA